MEAADRCRQDCLGQSDRRRLLKVEGHEQKLAGLIQERYAITRDEAMAQVKAFFDKNKP
jgi:uncharacterized protein YjbJ (UPF0337 family)